MADATKVQGVIKDWTLLDDTGSDSPTVDTDNTGAGFDIGAGAVDVELNIKIAHIDANAAGVNYVSYKVFGKYGANNEDWGLLTASSSGGGTAVKEDLNGNSATNEIPVADTTDWDTGLGEKLFIYDTANILNSEVVEIAGWHDTVHYTATHNLTNVHANTADLLDGLNEHRIPIPNGIRYVKVVFSNSDDDANYAVKVDYSAVSEYV